MRSRQTIGLTLGFCLVLVLLAPLPRSGGAVNDYEWFDPIIVVRRFLLDGFHEQPDEDAMQLAMISAMIETLDDPHTVFVPPAAEADFTKALKGSYIGIGAEVNIADDYLTIVTPLEDSPALAAGVQAGDIVLAIEGVSTLDVPIGQCIDLLLGEPDTPVVIRVRHTDGVEEDLTVIRKHIQATTVKGVRRIGAVRTPVVATLRSE